VLLKAGCASSITTVVDLDTCDVVKIRRFLGSAQICYVDFPGYNGTSHCNHIATAIFRRSAVCCLTYSFWWCSMRFSCFRPCDVALISVQEHKSGTFDQAGEPCT